MRMCQKLLEFSFRHSEIRLVIYKLIITDPGILQEMKMELNLPDLLQFLLYGFFGF